MIVGSAIAHQTRGGHYATEQQPYPRDVQGVSIVAPGGTMQLQAGGPTFINFYDGAQTFVRLPSRASVPIGYTVRISNAGLNAQFNIQVDSSAGTLIYIIQPEKAVEFRMTDQTPGNDYFYWKVRLISP